MAVKESIKSRLFLQIFEPISIFDVDQFSCWVRWYFHCHCTSLLCHSFFKRGKMLKLDDMPSHPYQKNMFCKLNEWCMVHHTSMYSICTFYSIENFIIVSIHYYHISWRLLVMFGFCKCILCCRTQTKSMKKKHELIELNGIEFICSVESSIIIYQIWFSYYLHLHTLFYLANFFPLLFTLNGYYWMHG